MSINRVHLLLASPVLKENIRELQLQQASLTVVKGWQSPLSLVVCNRRRVNDEKTRMYAEQLRRASLNDRITPILDAETIRSPLDVFIQIFAGISAKKREDLFVSEDLIPSILALGHNGLYKAFGLRTETRPGFITELHLQLIRSDRTGMPLAVPSIRQAVGFKGSRETVAIIPPIRGWQGLKMGKELLLFDSGSSK